MAAPTTCQCAKTCGGARDGDQGRRIRPDTHGWNTYRPTRTEQAICPGTARKLPATMHVQDDDGHWHMHAHLDWASEANQSLGVFAACKFEAGGLLAVYLGRKCEQSTVSM